MLIRHAVNDFVKTGRLAGWTPGVHLNTHGQAQATALGNRLANTRIDHLYSSPLERCLETAQAVQAHHPGLEIQPLEEIGEVRFGAWQGGELRKLSGRKLWRSVQIFPSRVRFPGGETIREAQMRAVNAIEMLNERHPRARIAVFSHSDVIKLIVTHFMGTHVDLFQRIDISPASLTILRLSPVGMPYIAQVNETSYLPELPKEDSRTIQHIEAPSSLAIDAIGEPGARVFYFQAMAEGLHPPLTLLMEKTQAAQLAEQIDAAVGAVERPTNSGALYMPNPVLFRWGRIALAPVADGLMALTIEEMLLPSEGQPRTLTIHASPGQLSALAIQAKTVVNQGKQTP
jgi:probable phosphomutase (TIGR03848 family)